MDINAAFKITAGVTGTDAINRLVRALGQASSAQADTAEDGKKLLGVMKEQLAALDMSEGEFLRYRASLAGVRDQAEPMISAMEKLKAATLAKADADAEAARQLRAAQKEEAAAVSARQAFLRSLQDQAATTGKSQDEILAYRAAQLGLTKEAEPFIARIREANQALYGSGASARQAANAMRQLPAQFNDVVVSIAGGQNPLMVLLQQGTQVVDSFGGVGEATRSITSLFTPFRVAVGGAAAVLGVLALAAYKADSEMEAMQRSIVMTGNAAGVTRDRIKQMAKDAQSVSGLTVGESKDVAAAAVGSGAFGPGTIDQATKAIALFQKVSDQATDDVVKGFAAMRQGVSKWANEYASKYALLKATDLERIRVIENTQGKEAAMRETLALVTAELEKRNAVMKEEQGILSQTVSITKQLFSSGWAGLKGIFEPATPTEKLEEANRSLKTAATQLERMEKGGYRKELIDRQRVYVEYLRQQVVVQEQAVASTERQAAANSRAADQARRYAEEMAKMADYSRAERAYTESAEALMGFTKRAIYELQMAAYQNERNRGLLTEYDYTKRVYDLRVKTLQLEAEAKMKALMRAKADQDAALASGDMQTQLNARTAYNKALKETQDAQLALNVAIESGSGSTAGMNARLRTEELERQAQLLRDQIKSLREIGITPNQSQLAGVDDDLKNKNSPIFGVDETAAAKLRTAASSVDALNGELKLAQAGVEFQKRTAAIKAETEALGLNATQKSIILAQQELENAGIKEGTALYQELMEQRTEAIRKGAEAERTWQTGLKQSINEYLDNAGNLAVQTKEVVTQAFQHMEDALVDFAMTGKLNFREFANAVIADIIRMQTRMAIANAVSAAMNYTGFNIPGFGPSTIGSAKGNAFSGGQVVSAFAKGGAFTNTLATKPTVAPMALFGEAGPEAIMPLARDSSGRLGVRAQGAQGGGDNITVTVVVNMAEGTAQTTASGAGDAETAKQLGNAVAGLVKKQLVEEMRNPGGLLYAGRRS